MRLISREGMEVGGEGEKGERIEGSLEECLEEARGRTEGYYREEVGVDV